MGIVSCECTALFMFSPESLAGTYLAALSSNCRDTDASGDVDHGRGHEGLLHLGGTALYSDRHLVFLGTAIQWRDVDVLSLTIPAVSAIQH